jgi:NTP pyrophosphatase (non-canonical NTP hydrolase)
MMDLDDISRKSHANAVDKGFWDVANRYKDDTEVQIVYFLSKISLITSENSEVLEAVRKDKGSDEIMAEFADIIIRLGDLYEGMRQRGYVNGSLARAVENKMNYNTTRPKMHGVLA